MTQESLNSGSLDYVQFCGAVNPINILSTNERVSVENYAKIRTGINPFTGMEPSKDSHILIDVREKVQFDLCNLEGSINVPFSVISRTHSIDSPNSNETETSVNHPDWVSELRRAPEKPVFVFCRLGNDSQLAVRRMKQLGLDSEGQRWIGDIKGGLRAWREGVDKDFPEY